MAMPAVKHFDPVIGLDVHTVIIPPSPAPIPIPHPHVGFVLDLRECVNGVKSVVGSIVFSFAAEAAADVMEDNPELLAAGMALVSKAGSALEAAANNPVVKTGLALKDAKDQLSGLKAGIIDTLGGNIGGAGGSNRPVKSEWHIAQYRRDAHVSYSGAAFSPRYPVRAVDPQQRFRIFYGQQNRYGQR